MVDASKFATTDAAPFAPNDHAVLARPPRGREDGGWLAMLPDLPACLGDGENEGEAIGDARSAASEWADARTFTAIRSLRHGPAGTSDALRGNGRAVTRRSPYVISIRATLR